MDKKIQNEKEMIAVLFKVARLNGHARCVYLGTDRSGKKRN